MTSKYAGIERPSFFKHKIQIEQGFPDGGRHVNDAISKHQQKKGFYQEPPTVHELKTVYNKNKKINNNAIAQNSSRIFRICACPPM